MKSIGATHLKTSDQISKKCLNLFQHFVHRKDIEGVCREMDYVWRNRIWCPFSTILGVVWQQLHGVGMRSIEQWLALALDQLDQNHDGKDFCEARKRLPLQVFELTLRLLGSKVSKRGSLLRFGLKVCYVDGTTSRTEKTSQNISELGCASNKIGRTTIPLLRWLTLSCAGTGVPLDAAANGYGTHSETRLFSEIIDRLIDGLLIIGDSGFCAYLSFSRIKEKGSDLLVRAHPNRKGKRIKRLGYRDELYLWKRPHKKHLKSEDSLARLSTAPKYLKIRKIQRTIRRRGYRSWTLTIYTSLLDPKAVPAGELASLYLKRWEIETDFRTLKEEYGLERLKGKTPASVKRELYGSLMAFALVRAIMAETNENVRTLSSCQAKVLIRLISERMAEAPLYRLLELYKVLLRAIASSKLDQTLRLPQPRNIIMRKRQFIKLTIPREEWRKRIIREAS